MRNATAWLVSLVLCGSWLCGCTRAIKEGLGGIRGAKGIYAADRPLAATKEQRPLGAYGRYELARLEDDFGGKVPPELFSYLPEKFQHYLAEAKLASRSGKTLLIRGRVLYYEDASTLAHALGPFEEAIAKIELVDAESNQVLGTAYCIGRTKESVNQGVEKKADGLAKAIVSWIADRTPKTE
jgi:hypothetical protein